MDVPERIWLQVDPNGECALEGCNEVHDGITWCQDRINDSDVEYVRRFKFQSVSCSGCSGTFGPRDSGYSRCGDHVADAFNREVPGHALKYDGLWVESDDGIHQWTPHDGPVKYATFATVGYSLDAVKAELANNIEKFTL